MSATKVIGGKEIIDSEHPIDPDESELHEKDQSRPVDELDVIIRESYKRDIGPCVVNRMFYVQLTGLRPQDITFDRAYPMIGLLIHAFDRQREVKNPAISFDRTRTKDEQRAELDKNATEDTGVDASIKEHSDTARELGWNFLPIIDGEIDRDDLKRVTTIKAKAALENK